MRCGASSRTDALPLLEHQQHSRSNAVVSALPATSYACSQLTIDWSQDIVVDYVTTMMHKAMDESTKRGKLATEDLVYLVRKVPS